jgi:hypothetical protein
MDLPIFASVTDVKKAINADTNTYMTEDEAEAGQQHINAKFEEIRNGLPGKIRQLEGLLRKYDPFNVIANISLRQHIYPATNPSIATADQLPVIVEYITLLYLKQPYYLSAGEFIHAQEMMPDIAQMMSLAEEIVFQNSLFLNDMGDFDKDDTLKHIVRSLAAEEYFVRNPAIEEHHWTVFEGLYSPYDGYLKQTFGFNSMDGRDLCGCIQEFLVERFQELKKEYTAIWSSMFNEIMLYRKKGKKPLNFYPDETLAQLSAISEKQLKDHFVGFAEMRMTHFLGERLSFTAEALAEYSGVELEVVNNFLKELSSQFNSVDSGFEAMAILHPLKDRPIIQHEDRYLCSSISLLDWAVDRLFASTLVQKKPKFAMTKHDYILEKGMELLQKMLQNGTPYQQLRYDDGNNGELDGLNIYDNYAFFVEVKGNAVSDKAKGGNLNKIKDHIDDIIDHSHQQAVRAARYFKSADSTNYKNKKGQTVSISSAGVKHIFYISLSLDPISNIANHITIDNSLNLFTEGIIPWVVNLYDLMVIADFIEGPSFFIHFLIRRSEFFKARKMKMTDELDILIYYLQDGLHYDYLENDNTIDQYEFQSQGEIINDYYFYQAGMLQRKVVKPSHYAIHAIKTIVHGIDPLHNLVGRTEFTVELLSLSTTTQKTFAENMAKYKKLFKKDGQVHDFSLTGTHQEKVWGLTYFMDNHTPENINTFHEFCWKKFVDRAAHRWVGIFDCGKDHPEFIVAYRSAP